ncbi:MAG: sigma-70 family RNA polymerase sigma factor [Acidobacteria bacterium]|nr:sigma-70 family RNA polymerase sigma factor [Acidobacteriota bacterium]
MTNGVAEIALMTEKLNGAARAPEGKEPYLAPLVERARAGDTTAFEQIMVISERRVVSTAWRILGDREDARDAAQEVFLRAYKYLGSFREDQNFSGWLYRITVNVCRDIARKRSHGGHKRFISYETELEEGLLETIPAPDDTERHAIEAQERHIVSLALSALSLKERSALVLRDMEGLSTEEVAEIMGTRAATVRSQIASGRTKIKRYCDRFLKRRGRV